MNKNMEVNENHALGKYLSPLSVWALSFGCAVGWGAFVMPGTTFLPQAGPIGTILGLLIGAAVMFIIGVNYNYLINKYPDAGGTLTYTIRIFGYDHGFMSSWFLILVYIAIAWANATALGLISKNLFGSTFQFGFHYSVLGYDVYFGEVLLSMVAILACGFLCSLGKRVSAVLQTIFALILMGSIIICGFSATAVDLAGSFEPAFVPDNGNHLNAVKQISTIAALAPWAFVGFESVSNSASGFKFKPQKTKYILTAAIICAAVAYVSLVVISVLYRPSGYDNWYEYIKNIGNLDGLEDLPAFYAAHRALGKAGVFILGLAAFAGIMTGLIGNFIAGSRLLYSMAEDDILPKWFGVLNKDKSPQNAFLFLTLISLIVPFFGRTAIGWIIDVNTIGATIAYAYTSACAIKLAAKDNNRFVKICGEIGILFSLFFFIYFMAWSAGAMATESYLILAIWSILGFVYFRFVFARDKEGRFGQSTIVWITLLFLIFFTSLMWVKQATDELTEEMAENISTFYASQNLTDDPVVIREAEEYLEQQLVRADNIITRNSFIQMMLIIASLAIMFSIYTMMMQRQKEHEVEKFKAQAQNKAKTQFLSNMSHDIRTPMNAIIGYITLAEDENVTMDELKDYLGKIKSSSNHLLALINDVLEMSRIESGKMDLEPVRMNIGRTLNEVKDLFQTQMDEKHIDFIVDHSGVTNGCVYCDKNRLNRVLLNLVSNAYKFTPSGGVVRVTAVEKELKKEGYGNFEIRVRDSGIGMSEEFAAKVFEAFEREKTSTVSGIQGTGLGMSITKSIIDLMGGNIYVNTKKGQGTEFVIELELQLQEKQLGVEGDMACEAQQREIPDMDYSKIRVLLADDMQINREIATKMLTKIGFMVEQAENGKDAVDKVVASEPGYYDVVLMDVQMPVMGGYEATEHIRKLDNEALSAVPIIAMTANAFSEDVKRALDAGMNGHVAKPIDIKQLVTTISNVVQKK